MVDLDPASDDGAQQRAPNSHSAPGARVESGELRQLVALAIACQEEEGEDGLRDILEEHPELAPVILRRLGILQDLGLLQNPLGVRFRRS